MNIYLNQRPMEQRAPTMSTDGYVRLPLASLNGLSFVHLFSESDGEFLRELRVQTVPARSAGFSEWKSDSEPPISLGWGWFIHEESDAILLAPDGVRSNVMLVDKQGYDLGPIRTSHLFCTWLNTFPWQNVVNVALDESECATACQT
jgi:hypothetical protein